MEDKIKIKFMERKRRSIDQLAKDFGELSRTLFPSQELFIRLRNELTLQERLHGKVGKDFLKYEDSFWDNYNVRKFCYHNDYTYLHLKRCRAGSKSYSPLLQESIIQWVKSGAKQTSSKREEINE
jgi:hypothetical protein